MVNLATTGRRSRIVTGPSGINPRHAGAFYNRGVAHYNLGIPLGKPAGQKESPHLSCCGEGITMIRVWKS